MVRTLYKLDGSPPSRSAHMMLDLLGLEADYVDVNLLTGEHMAPEYRERNPVHTVPTLDDNGFNIFESNAIAAYLVDKYAKDDSLYPKDLQKRAIVNQRLHFNSGILFPALRGTTTQVIFQGVGKVTDERKTAITSAYKLLESLLGSHSGPWLAGDQLTIADICSMSTVSSLNNMVPIDIAKCPKSKAWLDKCSELPTFQKINVPGNEILNAIFNMYLPVLEMVLTLYKLDASPPGRAAHMVADLLGLDVTLVDVNIGEGAHLTQEYMAKNPQHTIPMIEDDDFCIWDSHAISAYLVEKYASDDSLYPKDLKKRALVDQRLHFDSGILFPATRGTAEPILSYGQTYISEESVAVINKAYGLLEALLASSGPWLAGDQLTIADICCISNITSLDAIVPVDEANYPNLTAWMKKCMELPTVQKINVPGNEQFKTMILSKLT